MSIEIAKNLYNSGRSHALASELLFKSAVQYGHNNGLPDPDHFAFNGTYSLSIHYLIGLGLELMLKAAYVAYGGHADDKHLREAIGHDVLNAYEKAVEQGFDSQAPRLRDIVDYVREPYKGHYFRYHRPEEFPLPDVLEVMEAFQVLDDELEAKLYPIENAEAQP